MSSELARNRFRCTHRNLSDPQAGTTAVDRQYLETVTVHGREYQKYSVEHSIHLVPVDEVQSTLAERRSRRSKLTRPQEEADRLESQHRVFDLVFDQRLIFPPLTNVKNVLDCGYGASSWAIEVADSYPEGTVRQPCSCHCDRRNY